MTPSKTTMTLGEAEKDPSSSLWVLNTSNPKGTLNFPAPDGMGSQMIVTLQVTWIPIDITTKASKASILASAKFRELLTRRFVQIITEEYASDLLSDPDARKEELRVLNIGAGVLLDDNQMPTEVKAARAEESGDVSGLAMHLAAATSGDEDVTLNTLRGNESAMTKADLQYIAQNSVIQRVKEYAAKKAVSL